MLSIEPKEQNRENSPKSSNQSGALVDVDVVVYNSKKETR